MIFKIVDQLTNDILSAFKAYGISVAKEYTPDLEGVRILAKDLYHRQFHSHDNRKYQNRLLYSMGTPVPSEFGYQNYNMELIAGDLPEDGYTVTREDTPNGEVTKILADEDNPDPLKSRKTSILQVPINFSIITENTDTLDSIILLYYQELTRLTVCSVDLKINPTTKDQVRFNYFVKWNISDLDVSWATFEEPNMAFNMLNFSLDLHGAFISRFGKDIEVITSIENTTEINHE